MTIDHVIDFDGVWKGNVGYGHHFQANFSYAYHLVDSKSGEVPGDCGLQWWEKTNHPYVKGEKVDHWYDQHAMLPNADFWYLWNHREKPCPGSVTDFIPDTPLVIASDHPGTYIRFMCFLIAITKAPGCHCPDSGKKATAKQGLWVVNRKGYLRFFVTPSDDQIYSCKFP